MKDTHLKEMGILPEQLMINDRINVRICADKITKKNKKKTSPNSTKKKYLKKY